MNLLCKDFSVKSMYHYLEKLYSQSKFPKFPGDFRDFAKNFQEISGIFAKFPGCFQDCGLGVGDFIPKPGFLYLFRSRNTFSNWKKKKSWMGNVQNFTLTTVVVFPDQE